MRGVMAACDNVIMDSEGGGKGSDDANNILKHSDGKTAPKATRVLGAFLVTNELTALMHLDRADASGSNGADDATARRASATYRRLRVIDCKAGKFDEETCDVDECSLASSSEG